MMKYAFWIVFLIRSVPISEVNLEAECNLDCRCDERAYSPICGTNGIEYFSPCHGACRHNGLTEDGSWVSRYKIIMRLHCTSTIENSMSIGSWKK